MCATFRNIDLFDLLHLSRTVVLQHYRNLLKCMQLIQNNTERDDEEYEALSHIVHEMQVNNTIKFVILLMI